MDADLEYRGAQHKRPPGAGLLVQKIYALLVEHPDGMTVDDLWRALRDGWMFTDAYRAYDRNRGGANGTRSSSIRRRTGRRPAEYGTDLFKERAQRWCVRRALRDMAKARTAIRKDALWFVGGRAPKVPTIQEIKRLKPMDAVSMAAHGAANAEFVRRENVKGALRDRLADRRVTGKTRVALQSALDLLSGR